MSSVPIISLKQSEEAIASQLRRACIDHGFLYLTDHGISSDTFAKVLEQSKALFDLPLSDKQALSDTKLSRGYTAFQEETLDPTHQTEGDTKEGFYIAQDYPEEHPMYNPAKLRGPNQWPNPNQLPEFRPIMEDYFAQMSTLGFRVTQLLALSLQLPDKHYFNDSFRHAMAALRLLHYDGSRPSRPDQGILACGAHSDYGMLTFLLTDQTPGLQIQTKPGTWMDVPPLPGALVVNLGDMLERWTNGLYRSTVHRVLTHSNSGVDRYSIPFFYEPDFDTLVSCLSTCCNDTDNPPCYPPITSGQHLLDKYHQTHADFQPSPR